MSDAEAARTMGIGRIVALISTWDQRCIGLARDGKYWQAAQLSEAANELRAIVADARAPAVDQHPKPNQLEQILPPPTAWPSQWPPNSTRPYDWSKIQVVD